ncbi:hypothetical protein CRE_01875 [Caenorhabditis remanei]|uniref:F-box associated domain-containing protein n=1 Tax=Caenorhabditis remanei TaxID=31234 RepID=E3LG06_CAERE|nr:hypothetical protein CRE_01875 [Caenorhabditis remanei]
MMRFINLEFSDETTFSLFKLYLFVKRTKNALDSIENRKTRFPLAKLPFVPMKEVIRSMTVQERIKLALSSYQMEYFVELARVKASSYFISFKDQKSYIQLEVAGEMDGFVYLNGGRDDGNIRGKEISKWCCGKSMSENIARALERIQNLFPSPNVILTFHTNKMTETSIKELLSSLDWKILLIEGDKIEATDLDIIMNMANLERKIMITLNSFPENFTHEKVDSFNFYKLRTIIFQAFQFLDMEYHEAHWVRIEDLFSLRNSISVTLMLNHFNCPHLNQLICFWMECTHSMFRQLTIHMGNTSPFLPNLIFKDVTYLTTSRRGFQEFVMLVSFCVRYDNDMIFRHSRSATCLEFPIAVISWIDSSFKMITTRLDGEYSKEYSILKLLSRKNELEEEIAKTDSRLPVGDRKDDLSNQPMISRKSDLLKKIRYLNNQLKDLQVELIDGNVVL